MMEFKRLTIVISLVILALQSTAQKELTLKQVNKRLKASQKSFTSMLDKNPMDKDGKAVLNRFILFETDSLHKIIVNNKGLQLSDKIKALNCQCNLLDTLQSEIKSKTFDISLVNDSRDNFIPLWQNIITEKPYDDILKSFRPESAGIMAAVFKDYPQADNLKDIAALKKLQRSPENIIDFLSNNINYKLRDSLIFIYGNNMPDRLISFVTQTKNDELVKIIRENPSPLIQTLLSIANEKNLKNYLPFVVQLSEKQLTMADIDRSRGHASEYFRLIVDAELANRTKIQSGITPLYVVPTKKYLKEYAIMFFTDVINSLHEEPKDKDRYFVLEDLRPQDLYFIITNGEAELYTSSYLYTYKKLMGTFEKTSSDSLFRLVKYDQYRKFLLMAGRYNTLAPFMQQMPKDSSIGIIKRLMNGLESSNNIGLEEIVNVAETFPSIVKDPNLSALTSNQIKVNYARCQRISSSYGMKVYNLLTEIFKAVQSDELGNKSDLNPVFKSYYKVSHNALREKNGNITQLVLFYGDDDGKSSYASFLSNFSDASQWGIEKNEQWITIKSKKLHPISIYANLPLSYDDGKDIKAQDALAEYLKNQQIEPHILIHRGHSYHLSNSIKFVSTATQLSILGSCGGYTEIYDILKKSPQAQVISTKQIGSMQINEPIIKMINDKLLNGKDLNWFEMWTDLEKQFKSNKLLYDYFKEYVPPYKNIALLVTALYSQAGLQSGLQ